MSADRPSIGFEPPQPPRGRKGPLAGVSVGEPALAATSRPLQPVRISPATTIDLAPDVMTLDELERLEIKLQMLAELGAILRWLAEKAAGNDDAASG